jgi:dienelactone hydrolase
MKIPVGNVTLEGDLVIPKGSKGLVVFAHGSGSGRFSPRNRFVAAALNKHNIATLLMDLLTADEEAVDDVTAELRFDIPMLAKRVVGAVDFLAKSKETKDLSIGIFGASTGAAAALIAAAERPSVVKAVVSRGGRPDLAMDILPKVKAPTLLIVGGLDDVVIGMNEQAFKKLKCDKKLVIVPGATHLFEEPGTLEKVAALAAEWFRRYLEK